MNDKLATNDEERSQSSKSGRDLPLFETTADAVKIGTGSLLGLAAVVYCFYAATNADSVKSVPSVLLCIFSLVVGWIMGIVMTPSSSGEKTRFSEYGKALAAAATGFLAGQYKDIIAFSREYFEKQPPELTAIAGLLAGCCFLIGLLFTFIFRSYVRGGDAELRGKRAKATIAAREAFEKLAAIDRNDA